MADIYDRAEELNQVSALYNVEIDGVPLQQMSTNELAKVGTSAMLRPPLLANGSLRLRVFLTARGVETDHPRPVPRTDRRYARHTPEPLSRRAHAGHRAR